MHVEYKVKCMDHDYVAGSQHKVIVSVYVRLQTLAISYNRGTFIRITREKYMSNAYTHAFDVWNLFESKLVQRKPWSEFSWAFCF